MLAMAIHSQIRAERGGGATAVSSACADPAGVGPACADVSWACPCTSKLMRKLNPRDSRVN
jgi:hypothetical protein